MHMHACMHECMHAYIMHVMHVMHALHACIACMQACPWACPQVWKCAWNPHPVNSFCGEFTPVCDPILCAGPWLAVQVWRVEEKDGIKHSGEKAWVGHFLELTNPEIVPTCALLHCTACERGGATKKARRCGCFFMSDFFFFRLFFSFALVRLLCFALVCRFALLSPTCVDS